MLSSVVLLVATAFTGLVNAQNYSTSGPLTIDPNTESPQLRGQWCRAQITNCPLICGGIASDNTCDPDKLTYDCTCQNGNQPNISNYANTIPSFVCNAWVGLCVDAHPNDLDGITACRSVQCGNETTSASTGSGSDVGSGANVVNTTSGVATMTTTTTTSSTGSTGSSHTSSGSPSSSSPAPKGNAAAAAYQVGSTYATSLTVVGLLAIFGLVL